MTVVKIRYPVGLQDMISMFRMCATARLFIDFMLPSVDAGIFLDTDILLMDDIKVSPLKITFSVLYSQYSESLGAFPFV